jgi:spore coat polysaccharide biosynthesis protein SpsF
MLVAILQARVSSQRLPRKVMAPILGKPLLLWTIERVQRARTVDELVVATSSESADDELESLCKAAGVHCYRGSLNDVLDRFYQAAVRWKADEVVRLTGDNPLIDPQLIDDIVAFYRAGKYDYAGNAVERTFPRGLDTEVFPMSVLELAWRVARRPYDREHVTTYHRARPDEFRLGMYRDTVDRSHLRWTVDEPADLEFVRRVYAALYPANPRFSRHDVHALLESNPELAQINAGVEQLTGVTYSREAA